MTWIREQVRPIALDDWTFELRDDDIARIRFRGLDVLRSVRAVVRDRDWATAVWRVASIDVQRDAVVPVSPVADRGNAIAESAGETGRADGYGDGGDSDTSRTALPGAGDGGAQRDDDHARAEVDGDHRDSDGTLAEGGDAPHERAARARIILRSDSFRADLRAVLDLVAHGSAFTVSLELTTARDFATNRTGLVVLHPPSLAGSPLVIEHTSGETTHTAFPGEISPHQPAFDIAALTSAGVRVAFDGDTFEMEDQRNWTDASYKTYSRPLSLPFPYELEAGATVRQSVAVTVTEQMTSRSGAASSGDSLLSSTKSHSAGALEFAEACPMPEITVGASTAPGDGGGETIGSALLVELDLGWTGWRSALARASGSGLPLDVRLVLPDTDPESAVADAVRELAPHRVARIAAFQPAGHDAEHVTDVAAARILRVALAERELAWPVIGGARSHFTELNRGQHLMPDDLDGIAFSTTPLFHTLETLQAEEAIAMQRLVAEQAVRIADGAPVHVGPITLRMHVNNVATTAPPRPSGSDLSEGYGPELLDADDERQSAHELAAWTIASAAALTVPGVASLSYFEEWGPRGIRAADGSDYPVADALRALAALEGPVATARTAGGRVWGIRSDTTLLLANLDSEERRVGDVDLPPRGWRTIAT